MGAARKSSNDEDAQATSSVEGVLGLNFLRGKRLTIDCRKGLVTLK
jgi:hypothetical protein